MHTRARNPSFPDLTAPSRYWPDCEACPHHTLGRRRCGGPRVAAGRREEGGGVDALQSLRQSEEIIGWVALAGLRFVFVR